MKVIEKTRLEGDKIVGAKSEKKRRKRGMDEMKSLKIKKFGKIRKDTRWKRGEIVVVERVRKQSESEDGGMRELREI